MDKEIFKVIYSIFKFNIKFRSSGSIPMFKSSGIRGAIGSGLILNNCIYKKPFENCSMCSFQNLCAANNFFNSRLKKELYFVNDGNATAYVIECENYEEQIEKGDELSFTIILFGEHISLISHLIQAAEKAGNTDGLYSLEFDLVSVTNEKGEIFWEHNHVYKENLIIKTLGDFIIERKENIGKITGIQLLTPFRYKKNGKFTDEISIEDIFKALNRRLQILGALNDIEINDYFKESRIVELRKQVKWVDLERYSGRQRTRMKLGGVMGAFEIAGELNENIDYLLLGELIHIGKSNSFGLGKYRVF